MVNTEYYCTKFDTNIIYHVTARPFILWRPLMTVHVTLQRGRTLGYLISQYRLPSNPKWVNMRPRRRSEYEQVFTWLAPYRHLPLAGINLSVVKKIHGIAFERKRSPFANRVLLVMNTLFNWAVREHLLQFNPAARLKSIGRPEDRPNSSVRGSTRNAKSSWAKRGGGLTVALALGLHALSASASSSNCRGAPAAAMLSDTAGGAPHISN